MALWSTRPRCWRSAEWGVLDFGAADGIANGMPRIGELLFPNQARLGMVLVAAGFPLYWLRP
jgi:hypothetical protein